ncbi:MAG: polyphosphate polymerase domain-containing protein [Oscillospiraceae bacterium]|jgi:hypothetical protein|nr:polyphosphate polymerase domain-containing protein [Oscillospiraceae bacterium]
MQNIFKRYEQKYLITPEQAGALHGVLSRHMVPDSYGEYLVQNLYYDTENWDIIRACADKPPYKEKLRLRCYGVPGPDSEVFLELKKKYAGVVYKRRIAFPVSMLGGGSVRAAVSENSSQIARELKFYLSANPVFEKIYISYRRRAFAGTADEGLRVTFDADIRFRTNSLDYFHPDIGQLILPRGKTLMEIKTPGGIPVWMARTLCEAKVFPATFSKYGACYAAIADAEKREVRISA